MNNLTSVPSTSISPPFDARRELEGSVVPRTGLSARDRSQMYDLLAAYFSGTDRARFDADLAEKESVVLLRDGGSGRIRGFSTMMRITAEIDGREIVAFFSGDTIVDQQYWGETVLSRVWSRHVFAEAERIAGQRPSTRVYWFLICSGYKTYRFLPVFFREFYPHPAVATPPEMHHVIDHLGRCKFGGQYKSGIVRFDRAPALRPGVADITEQRMCDPVVAFFARANPGHAEGDELACITEISRANLTRAGARMVG